MNKKINLILLLSILLFSSLLAYQPGETIKSATEFNYPPFSITDSGIAEGFSVDLLKETLKSEGYEVSFYIDSWTKIKEELANGTLEVLPLVGRTPERESIYDFTVPYLSIYGGIFIRANESEIKSIEDLKNKQVLVMKGDNAEEFAFRENISSKIISIGTYEEAFKLLSEGKYDALITQKVIGEQIILKLKISNVVSLDEPISNFKQDFTFAVKEGDSELLAILNEGLSKIISDGTYAKIYEKWFKEIKSQTNTINTLQELNSAERIVKQKAEDVAKQIEIYLKAYPEKTLKDLQEDPFFQEIAVQKVGETGYTFVYDYENMVNLFHKDKEFIGINYTTLKDQQGREKWWEITGPTQEGKELGGAYLWKDTDGIFRERYKYTKIISIKTSDEISLAISAAAYVYELSSQTPKQGINENVLIKNYPFIFLGILIFFSLLFYLGIHFGIFQFEKNKITLISLFFILIIIFGLAAGSYLITNNIKETSLNSLIEEERIIGIGKINEISATFLALETHLNYMEQLAQNLEIQDAEMIKVLKENYELTKRMTYASYRIDKNSIIQEMYPIDFNSLGADISTQEHMIEISKNHKPVISGVFRTVEGFQGITLQNPVMKNNNYDGTVAFLINLDKTFKTIKSLQKLNDKPLYLLDQNKNLIYSTETSEKNSKEYLIKTFGEEPLNALINQEINSISFEEENINFIATITPFEIRGERWHLIILASTERIYQDLQDKTFSIFLITLISIISLIFLAYILNQQMTKKLKEDIEEKTKELNQKVIDLVNTKKALMNMMEDMKIANEDLKKLDKTKTEFLNITSHELKTPLTAMMAYMDILEDSKDKFTKEELESFETLRRNAKDLKSLIGNILEVARMDSGKFELIKTKTNLKKLFEEKLEEIKILAKQKKIKLTQTIGNLPEISVDQERMGEVMNNLISNAIKFTPEGGSIEVHAKKIKEFVEIKISDTGEGISKEEITKLFHPFYQVDASISRKYGGTGLGLSITKKIVEAHEGSIEIQSELKKGTTFTIKIPIKKE